MYTKKNFIKRNKYKLIGFCIFSFCIIYFINLVGYKNIPNLPQDFKSLWKDYLVNRSLEEQAPIDFERAQFLNDSLQAESQKSNEVTHKIKGNFDGTGFIDYAFISPNSGHIVFSKGKAFSVVDLIELNPNDDKLFEEGDLDNDGADDFSVYRYKKGWHNEIITYLHSDNAPWIRCLTIYLNSDEKATDADIKARVFRKKGKIYFLDKVRDKKNNEYKLVSKSLNSFKAEQSGIGIMVK